MNVEIENKLSGKIDWLEVRDKHGNLKVHLENIPNTLLNGALGSSNNINPSNNGSYLMASTAETYDDVDGTWNQSGNTISRATGSGVFPSSPSKIGDELYWYDAGSNTGHRCHVTARASDTSITVSGVVKTITGGKLRRFSVNDSGVSSSAGFLQQSFSQTQVGAITFDDAAGTKSTTYRHTFVSTTSAFTVGSIILSACARVKLPVLISVDIEDQVQFEHTVLSTFSNRSQVYELGVESIGVPQKYPITSIVGNGTNVDVTFSQATHFLAGDKLDLRGVVPKRFSISSASSTSTTFTINTTLAHGLNPGDSVVIENASLAGYNGTHTVATVIDTDTITITNAANPGVLGVSGTICLATPTTYFDDLGLATIASMVSTSVARITSAITGPAVDTVATIGGDPGVTVKFRRQGTTGSWYLAVDRHPSLTCIMTATNARPIMDELAVGAVPTLNGVDWTDQLITSSNYTNDWTHTIRLNKNAGTGTDIIRAKQVTMQLNASAGSLQVTLNTPFNKSTAERLRMYASTQAKRDLNLTGLP